MLCMLLLITITSNQFELWTYTDILYRWDGQWSKSLWSIVKIVKYSFCTRFVWLKLEFLFDWLEVVFFLKIEMGLFGKRFLKNTVNWFFKLQGNRFKIQDDWNSRISRKNVLQTEMSIFSHEFYMNRSSRRVR